MESHIEYLRSQIDSGISQSDLIALMKSRGLPIIDAIKAFRELFSVNLGIAKQLVASHPAYNEIASASAPVQEDLIRAFENASTKVLDSD